MEPRPVPGSCLCGAVTFEATPPTLFCAHCHCTMCQRSHGAGYVTWFAVPCERFQVTRGADRLIVHASSEHGRRSFCGACGSSLFCENDAHPERIDIALAGMRGGIDREPSLHAYFSDRAPWVRVPEDGLPRLGGRTGLEPLEDEDEGEDESR